MTTTRIPPEAAKALAHLRGACRYEVMDITPAIAEEWKGRSPGIDDLPPHVIDNLGRKAAVYGRQMKAGKWVENGDPIIFSVDNHLFDGLARLMACIEENVTFRALVVWNVPREASFTIGSHLRRNASDILDINGERWSRGIAHAWPIIASYLNAEDKRLYDKSKQLRLSPNEMIGLSDRYPDIRESAEFVSNLRLSRGMGEAVGIAVHFILSLYDRAKAEEFLRNVADPTINPLSAAAKLAERFGKLKLSPQAYRLAVTIKGWNRYVEGRSASLIHLDYDGHTEKGRRGMEAFPIMACVPPDARIDLSGIEVGEIGPQSRPSDSDEADVSVDMDVVYVSPEEAAEYLKANGPVGTGRNRRLRPSHVKDLSRDMQGRWVFNAQPLKFSRSGRLLDGQHRCSASVQSKCGFITFVVRNLREDVFSTYDSGERKSLGKHLRRDGMPRAGSVSAALLLMKQITLDNHDSMTIQEGLTLLRENPGIEEAVRLARLKRNRDILPPSVGGALRYLFALKDPEGAETFFNDLAEGAMLKTRDPVLTLRKFLTEEKNKSRYPLNEQKAKITIQAWNYRRRGKLCNGFSTTDGFPEVL